MKTTKKEIHNRLYKEEEKFDKNTSSQKAKNSHNNAANRCESTEGEGETEDTLQQVRAAYNKITYDPKNEVNIRNLKDQHMPIQSQHLNRFPSRITTKIPDSNIVFSSEFCSGNLSRVCRGNNKQTFDLWVAYDAAPHLEGDYYKTWFYFSVTGVPQGEQLTFTFRNLNNQSKLYGQGLKPVFRVMPNQAKRWRRIYSKVNYYFNNDDQFTLSFNHMFSYDTKETTYFAFTYPFSYQESIEKTNEIEQRFANATNVYFNREILYYSLEGRPMELVTISSLDKITSERESIPEDSPGLFPAAIKDPASRPYLFEQSKKVVFFTSRVHPGETPGSHALNGFLDLLTDLKSEQGRCLRKNFVFKIIPILNPDGVSRGYYRLDTNATNLNRFYLQPKQMEQPTIWAAKKAVVQQATQYNKLFLYIDYHAHASKKGGFMFGNHFDDKNKQTDSITFCKLVAMNCLNFDMNECNFSDKIMTVKDKNGQSREGSSRVALNKATGCTYCYTLEFNYHNGKRINTLAPKFNRATSYVEPEIPVTDPNSKIYANTSSPPFTQDMFEDCGRAIGAALLDLIDDNPVSRVPLSCYKNVLNVRQDIFNNLQKYETGNVNVVGANNFASTNTKVAKAFANSAAPKVKQNPRGIDPDKLNKPATSLTEQTRGSKFSQKHGTFGVSKRILNGFDEHKDHRERSRDQQRKPLNSAKNASQPPATKTTTGKKSFIIGNTWLSGNKKQEENVEPPPALIGCSPKHHQQQISPRAQQLSDMYSKQLLHINAGDFSMYHNSNGQQQMKVSVHLQQQQMNEHSRRNQELPTHLFQQHQDTQMMYEQLQTNKSRPAIKLTAHDLSQMPRNAKAAYKKNQAIEQANKLRNANLASMTPPLLAEENEQQNRGGQKNKNITKKKKQSKKKKKDVIDHTAAMSHQYGTVTIDEEEQRHQKFIDQSSLEKLEQNKKYSKQMNTAYNETQQYLMQQQQQNQQHLPEIMHNTHQVSSHLRHQQHLQSNSQNSAHSLQHQQHHPHKNSAKNVTPHSQTGTSQAAEQMPIMANFINHRQFKPSKKTIFSGQTRDNSQTLNKQNSSGTRDQTSNSYPRKFSREVLSNLNSSQGGHTAVEAHHHHLLIPRHQSSSQAQHEITSDLHNSTNKSVQKKVSSKQRRTRIIAKNVGGQSTPTVQQIIH